MRKNFSPKATFQSTQNKNPIHTQMGMRGEVIDTKAKWMYVIVISEGKWCDSYTCEG